MMTQTGTDNPYTALARYYDAETADYTDDLEAYLSLAGRYGGPVLDVGCGTGRIAFALAGKGYPVVGVDSSPQMLQRAHARSSRGESGSERIRWEETDAAQFTSDERFGLAVFAYNGFMHLLEQGQQEALLRRVWACLKAGGCLAIDVANPVEMFRVEDTASLVVERIFTDPETGDSVIQQSVASVDRARQLMSVTWIYDRLDPEGIVRRDVIPMTVRYTMAAEMALLLRGAGFARVDLYGDYGFTPYDEESRRLLAVAVKANEP